jgi:hypothetical protein
MKKVVAAVGIVLLVVMSASLAMAQSYPDPGTSVTNAVTQNLATNAGENATVLVEYYDTAGNLDHTHSGIVIAPRAVEEIKTEDEPLGDGWQGSAVMSSDRPLGVVVSIKNTNVPGAADKITQGAYNGASSGANTLYFPSLYAFQYIVSRITVQNVDGTPANITMTYYDRQGNSLGSKTASLPAYSQRTFNLGVLADVPWDNAADFVDGSAVVTSSNLLAGAAVTTWGDRSAAYQALTPNNKGTTLYAPSHYRFMANPSSGKWTLFSALNLQNTSDSTPANVTATYVSRKTGQVAMTKTFSIPPLSAKGLNTKNGGDFPASDFNALSYAGGGVADWDGSVEITSSQPLVGICNTGWDEAIAAGAYALVTTNDSSVELFFPAQYRLDWGTGWAQWSAINLMNVGGSAISKNELTIEYIDQDGNTVLSLSGSALPFDLAKGGALGMNTRNGGDLTAGTFSPLGLGFIGGIHVKGPAGSQLVGVANIVYSNRASVYNSFPKP